MHGLCYNRDMFKKAAPMKKCMNGIGESRSALSVWMATVFVFLMIFIQSSRLAFAAAAVQRRAQMQQQLQAQAQQQMYQQAVAQKQAQEAALYQQAMAQQQGLLQQQAYQQQAYQQAAEYAAYKQLMQEAVAKRNAELQAAEQMKVMIAQKQSQELAQVQQAVAYKNTAELLQVKQAREAQSAAEALALAQTNEQIRQYTEYLAKRKAAMEVQTVAVQQAQVAGELAQYNEYQKMRAVQSRVAAQNKMQVETAQRLSGARMAQEVLSAREAAAAPAVKSQTEPVGETVVDIADLWRAMEVSARPWQKIIDREIKILTVAEYMDRFSRAGIKIRKSPGYYADMIDSVAQDDPLFLTPPFVNVLSYAAIMESDFDNGQDQEELARQVLGEQNYQALKARREAAR